MHLSRRELLAAIGLGVAVMSGCAPPPHPSLPGPPQAPAPSEDIAERLISWLRDHPDRASILVDDGRGTRLERRIDTARPVASAGKVVHLAAYARAVVAGRIDPAALVPVAEWERWYLPYTDGGAHPESLSLLGASANSTVSWDQLVQVMIITSDNAAPDALRATLGDAALVDAASAAGWMSFDLPSYLGETLLITVPERAGEPRRAVAKALAQEFADGGPIREIALEQTATALSDDDQKVYAWAGGTPAATVRQLAGLHLAAATDRLDSPAVSAIVRNHLEQPLADKLPPGALAAGQKGGSLPGVLSYAVTLRRTDGSVGVAALSLDGLSAAEYDTFGKGALGILAGRLLIEPVALSYASAQLP